MRIYDISVDTSADGSVLSGMCGDFKLWYKFPKSLVPMKRADAFVAASLIPSMALGTDIVLDPDIHVSPQLLTNLEKIQDIFVCWEKYLHVKLSRISIIGGAHCPVGTDNDQSIAFFSGGVDGAFTLKKNFEEIDYLLFAKGIDMQLTNDLDFERVFKRNAEYLSYQNKSLLAIETNVRFLGHHVKNIGWPTCFGGGLASIALALCVKRCFIASGVSYSSLTPEGSNYISDSLWGSEHTEIIHDGAELTRIRKLECFSEDPGYLSILRVCWHNNSENCGNCEKCLRTMSALRALGLHADSFPTFSDLDVRRKLGKLKIHSDIDLEFVTENLEKALEANDKVLATALHKVRKNYQMRNLLRDFDEIVLGRTLGRISKSVRGTKQES